MTQDKFMFFVYEEPTRTSKKEWQKALRNLRVEVKGVNVYTAVPFAIWGQL